MTIFKVTVERDYTMRETQEVEVEAGSAEEARNSAVLLCENGDDDGDWSEIDGDAHSDNYEAMGCEALADDDDDEIIDTGAETPAPL